MATLLVGGCCEHDRALRRVYAEQVNRAGTWGWVLTGQFKCLECRSIALDFVEERPSEVKTTEGERLSLTFRV